MAKTVVQIGFRLAVPSADYERAVAPMAEAIANVDGLEWKIWLLNEAECTAGGVYLFADETAAHAFLAGSLVAQVKDAPIVRDLRAELFGVLEDLTTITRGPVAAEAHNR
jgi:hypothetical protein